MPKKRINSRKTSHTSPITSVDSKKILNKMDDFIEQWSRDARDSKPSTSTVYEHSQHHHYHPFRQISTSLERKIRHGREHPPHSLPRLSVVLPCSTSTSVDRISIAQVTKRLSHGDESMTVVLSAFYAKLLIVLGLALPVTSTIQNELYTNITSDIFTMYLYVVSMLFLAYTFYHLRIAKKTKDDNFRRTRYGSFYLHMGVAGFSVGSIIYSCLQFGEYFDLSGDCQLIIVALKPALRIFFLIAQTIFIFSYTDVLDPMRGVVIDRFGLMHLIATNVCEWLNVIIQETRDDIVAVAYDRPALLRYTNMSGPPRLVMTDEVINSKSLDDYVNGNFTNSSEVIHANLTAIIEPWSCNVSDMITPLIRAMNPYLRPCGVEYSLLCSVIIVVIYNDICTVPGSINIWETVLFVLMTMGSGICIQRMRKLTLRQTSATMPLEHALLLVTQCGVYLYYLFQIIGAGFLIHQDPEGKKATRIIAPLCAVIQSSCQTLLVLDAWSRRCAGSKERPGRQLVTFLLVSNLALWLLNRVKNARAEFHPLQMEFYGVWAWTLITHVSVPLLVCYRFQATVCFYEIWKNSYKRKKEIYTTADEIELKNYHVA
ncbi:jg8178 [Pararge aegeria aegeria]|uniref:Jg8178 protein n=1 Tax=Pararge aegeria aegeria TaxID=348720 RepID=A0A8S4SHC7_9NEOP|nr:jg8178 [Pararge aegeria aegeria]